MRAGILAAQQPALSLWSWREEDKVCGIAGFAPRQKLEEPESP